ncbi:hypothetical protein [Risungbinella massiliensis]|uniref:hypothetical protein n=1 Tax=Risungbinella massiliensis TaxID=1329796 RepID=UPI0005CC8435|nr:hypothetical protein [Risungbinella massiliensis]
MQLSLSEMNILSTCLEKEQAKLINAGANSSESQSRLQIISQLQKKLRDLSADLSQEEQNLIQSLLQEEQSHLHGHEMSEYETIQQKLDQ